MEKPPSLQGLEDSDSASSQSSEDDPRAKGLTSAA